MDPSGSSTSSHRFALDPNDTSDIFVYKIREGTHITSQKKLCNSLDADISCRCSKLPIPRGASRIHIQTKDLFPEPERSRYAEYPNGASSVASVGLPRRVFWRRLLMGQFQDLYIVSPDHSPASSEQTSPEESRRVSPSSTFHVGGGEDGGVEGVGEAGVQRGRTREEVEEVRS